MSFVESLSQVFRGTEGRLLNDFVRVWLPRSRIYRRAAGYFSSSVFAIAFDEFGSFFAGKGEMELVCSPYLLGHDIAAIHDGLYSARHWEQMPLSAVLQSPRATRSADMLSWGIANRLLDIRIAVPIHRRPNAVYHEKFGVFVLREGGAIAFAGSANESSNGYEHNFERIVMDDTRRSCREEAVVRACCDDFEALWGNKTAGIDVYPIHQAFLLGMLRIIDQNTVITYEESRTPAPLLFAPPEHLRRPPRLALRAYQSDAITNWFHNAGVGIFAMATGTGKTITALCAVEELYRRCGAPLVIIIVAPYINLVHQWQTNAKEFGLDPIPCYGSRTDWHGAVDAAVYLVNSKRRPVLSLVTTNATFSDKAFQSLIARLTARTVLVADEVHNLGARNLRSALPDRVKLRLGLSATPERWMDEDGTAAIKEYFGKVVFDLDLRGALRLQPAVLTPYSYFPILVSLDEEEQEEYLRITRLLARYIDSPRVENLSDAALSLLLERARLVACARGKLAALAGAIAPYRTSRYNLVYCGDGHVEVEATSPNAARAIPETEVLRQVEAVARLLGRQLEMNIGIYTSDVPQQQRADLLKEFQHGDKQALVAIRCLDEGVDIPSVRRAFILASSTNPRQFIQRRGRVLRLADGKDFAEIFDFVVVPPIDAVTPGTPEYRVLRNLVAKEMARVTEFADLALNGPQAHARLLPVLSKLRLMHL